MNPNRPLKAALRGTRPATPSVAGLLRRLRADRREVEKVIRRLQRIQYGKRRRAPRPYQLGTYS
jgi:hypothetical protein